MEALRVVLATQNPGKVAELAELFPDWSLEGLPPGDLPHEDGETYLDNARLKARYGRLVAPPEAWVLADDSGLELDALEGGPGVLTARWAEGRHVEKALAAVEGRTRTGRYVCELVLLSPDRREVRGTGVLEGRVAERASGAGGFGFDPVFVPRGHDRTVADLGDDWKREHSHRALAAQALLDALR
ncbi:MAG TPA: non-canonical purine NTP pyrophosphatase [Gaiellaceae bacterium]|nr:non-canonical purine NTP pyrophosphatase [Gaiellaceae bacterium]